MNLEELDDELASIDAKICDVEADIYYEVRRVSKLEAELENLQLQRAGVEMQIKDLENE